MSRIVFRITLRCNQLCRHTAGDQTLLRVGRNFRAKTRSGGNQACYAKMEVRSSSYLTDGSSLPLWPMRWPVSAQCGNFRRINTLGRQTDQMIPCPIIFVLSCMIWHPRMT